ncbi:MAG: solute carrier family 13 (sodium-dependent dicarboxylate transporter), er 2/3/5 [Candidatus Binatota bacterium]|nr:solute carrier family 13 (sodium-dependent dicarboxylate transporter), er 2/3/5 [Candidatus Binatota bacterium]
MPAADLVESGEASFDLWRQRAGLVLAPIAFVALWAAPLALAPAAHRLAAVLAAVVVLWVTEAIPMAITAFLGVAVAVVLGVAPAAEAFAPFADPLVFLFIGTFMLAQAIFHHGVDRRFAFAILALPGVGDRPGRLLVAYALVACTISMWISNTATTAMMYPIGVSLLAFLESRGAVPAEYAAALLLSNAFGASVGGLATPVGTPPNLIGIGFLRRETSFELPFFSWMALGLPVVLVLFSVMAVTLARAGGAGRTPDLARHLAEERSTLGPWTRGQRNTIVAFALTVFFWVLPGITAVVGGQDHPLYRGLVTLLPEGVVALLGAGLLFVLPTDLRRHRFTLPWAEAVKIDWWIVFLYGGGIALGTLAFKTGLAEAIGRGLTDLLGIHSSFGLLALSTALAAVLSETTSNTASANMIVPVVIAFARSAGIDPVLPAIGATMGASLGFMLPVSTPCNAIVYGSGRIPLATMMRYGILLDVAGVVTIVAVVSLLGPWIRG